MQKKQNFILFGGGVLVMCAVAIPLIVLAQNLGLDMASDAGRRAGYDKGTNETTFATTIGTAIRVLLSFVGIIFTVLTVYAGILWMTARGNESQVETAKKTMQNSIIGLLIAIGSYSISGFVIQAFETGSGGGSSPSAESNQCCMLCNRTGLSGACNFSTLENNPELIIGGGPLPVPNSGQCSDLEDNYPACGADGRCVSRKHTDARCNE